MTSRLVVAYALIALLILAGIAVVWWNVYHSRRRTEARRQARLNEKNRRQDQAKAGAAES